MRTTTTRATTKSNCGREQKTIKGENKKRQRTTQNYQGRGQKTAEDEGLSGSVSESGGFRKVLWVDPHIPTWSPSADSSDVLLFQDVEESI